MGYAYSTEHKVTWNELSPSLQEMFKVLQSQIASISYDIDEEKKERESEIRELKRLLNTIKGKFPTTDYANGLDGQVKRLDADNNKTFWGDYVFITNTSINNCEGEVPNRSLVYNPNIHKFWWFVNNNSHQLIEINPNASETPIIPVEDTQNIQYAKYTPIYSQTTVTKFLTSYDILILTRIIYTCYNSSNKKIKDYTSTVYLPQEFKGVHPDSTLKSQMDAYITAHRPDYYDADFHLHYPHIPVKP